MKLFKQLSVILTLFSLLSVSMTTAIATTPNLADYPEPLIENGKYNFIPVYGDGAAGDDIAGAWDILSGLVNAQNKETKITGVQEEVNLGDTLNTEFGVIDDSDIEVLKDGEISFNGDEYDYHDELYTNLFSIKTSIESDNEYTDKPALEVTKGRVYRYIFDDPIDLTDADTDNPVKINVLSKQIRITDIKSNTEMKIQVGNEYFMEVGDSVVNNGKTVTLTNVGQNAIVIDVDGVIETISEGNTEYVNGLSITVTDLFFRDQLEYSSAELVIGKETVKTIKNGDDFLDENNDAFLVWELDDLETENPLIAVKIDQTINDIDDDYSVVGNGCLKLDAYLNVCLDGLTENDYTSVMLSYDDTDIGNAFILESDYDEAFDIGINEDINMLVFDKLGTNKIRVYYEDEHNDLVYLLDANNTEISLGDLSYKNLNLEVKVDSVNYILSIGNIELQMDNSFDTIIGLDAEGVNLVNRNDDVLLTNGVILRDPESNVDDNQLEFEMPSDEQKEKVSIRTESKVISSNKEVITEVAPPMVKASEVGNPAADNLLLIGGPAVNSLTAQFIGSTWDFKPGEAIIELKSNGANVALIVAGTDALDTRRACRVLRDYTNYDLTGTAIKVTGTSKLFTDTVVTSRTTTTTTLSGNSTT